MFLNLEKWRWAQPHPQRIFSVKEEGLHAVESNRNLQIEFLCLLNIKFLISFNFNKENTEKQYSNRKCKMPDCLSIIRHYWSLTSIFWCYRNHQIRLHTRDRCSLHFNKSNPKTQLLRDNLKYPKNPYKWNINHVLSSS